MPPLIVRATGALLLLSACGSAQGGNTDAAANTPVGATQAPSPVAAAPVPTTGKAETAFARQMATLLVGHATLDGQPVTGVRAIDKCHTVFATAAGETPIDWSKAGNLAPRDKDGREINRLPGTDGLHDMSVPLGELPEPAGNVANRSSGAFGQLALECGN